MRIRLSTRLRYWALMSLNTDGSETNQGMGAGFNGLNPGRSMSITLSSRLRYRELMSAYRSNRMECFNKLTCI